jgi:hypothetical protein
VVRTGQKISSSGTSGGGQHQFYDLFPLAQHRRLRRAGAATRSPARAVTGRHRFVLAGALVMLGPFNLNTFVKLPLGHRFVLLFIGTSPDRLGLAPPQAHAELPGKRGGGSGGGAGAASARVLCVAGLLGVMATDST